MVRTRQTDPSNSNFDASSRSQDESTVAGAKRKVDANGSPESKRGSKNAAKKQKTVEQTKLGDQVPTDAPTDAEIRQPSEVERANNKNGDTSGGQKNGDVAKDESESVEKAEEEKTASATVDPSDTVMSETDGHKTGKP
jgi:hypothetical protein